MFYVYIALLSNKGRRPLSYRITVDSIEEYRANYINYHKRAVLHICANKGLTMRDLKTYGYNTVTSRIERISVGV